MATSNDDNETVPLVTTGSKSDFGTTIRAAEHENKQPSTPISQQRQLLILFAFCVSNLCLALCYSLMMPFFPQEAIKKGGTATLSGLVLASYEFTVLIAAPVVAHIVPIVGGKVLLLSGACVASLCTIGFGLLEKSPPGAVFFTLAFASRMMEGVGEAMFVISSMTMRTTIFTTYFALAFALIEAMFPLGLSTGPAVGGALYSLGGYWLPFFVLGTLAFVLNFFQALIIPGKRLSNLKSIDKMDETIRSMKTPSMRAFFLQPSISFSFLIMFTGSFAITFLNSILSFQILPLVGNAAKVGYVSFTVGLGSFLMGPIMGLYQHRGGSSLAVICFGFFSQFLGTSLVGPSPLLPFLHTSIPLVITGCVLFGAGTGCLFTAPYKLALEAAFLCGYPKNESTYAVLSACIRWCFSCGAVLGPITGGALQDYVGFRWALVFVSIIPLTMLMVSVTCLILSRPVSEKRQ